MMDETQSGLTPEKLQFFLAGLSGLDAEEVRKAKVLFIRNEFSQLKALKTQIAGFGVAQGCFAVIPVFWPVLWVQRNTMNAAITLRKELIQNALSVWQNELGEDGRQMARELQNL